MSKTRPNPNFSIKPNRGNDRTSRPQGSSKPNTTKQPNPNYVPPASVKKDK